LNYFGKVDFSFPGRIMSMAEASGESFLLYTHKEGVFLERHIIDTPIIIA